MCTKGAEGGAVNNVCPTFLLVKEERLQEGRELCICTNDRKNYTDIMRLNGNLLVSVDVNFTQNIVMVHKEKKRGDDIIMIDVFHFSLL